MQKPQSNNNKPFFNNIDTSTYVKEVISFIENKIISYPEFFKQSSDLQNLPKTKTGEDLITQNLCSFFSFFEKDYAYSFTKQENYQFQFINQSKGEGNRTYDIGIILVNPYGSTSNILAIEAKRLPTPGSGRVKEYILGNYGGIERFKKEVHSQEIPTSTALMIGYIQKNDSKHWLNKVNEWIGEQIVKSTNPDIFWYQEDKLVLETTKNCITKLKSIHTRKVQTKLKISHYWIDLQ